MTLDALAKSIVNGHCAGDAETYERIRAALAEAHRQGMERAAKLCEKVSAESTDQFRDDALDCAAAIRAEMEEIK
jgi:regulator of sigma D